MMSLQGLVQQGIAAGISQGMAAPGQQQVRQPQSGMPTSEPRHDETRTLDEKNFKRLENFKDQGKEWRHWLQKFKVVVGAKSKEVLKAMEKAEVMTEEASTMSMPVEDEFVEMPNDTLERLSAELHEVLFLSTSGESLALVQSVVEMDGIAAWQKLHRHYNPRTMARTMQRIMYVVAPPKVLELKNLVMQVEAWEKSMQELEAESKEKVLESFRMAILTIIVPASIQDVIFQKSDEATTFRKMTERVVALANNRITI